MAHVDEQVGAGTENVDAHVRQFDAEPLHVAQLLLQLWQVPVDVTYVPTGHCATQTPEGDKTAEPKGA